MSVFLKSADNNSKRQSGCYDTKGNPFMLAPFKEWAERINIKKRLVLEPFAGANNIVRHLHKLHFTSYDIHPRDAKVRQRDTIRDFPKGYEVVITNPPWLAKNSAKRRGLFFPKTQHDDLYKHCLELCLRNCNYIAALIPATFLQSRLFRERLEVFIVLHDRNMFSETDNPVALALFGDEVKTTKIYYDDQFIGELDALEKHLPRSNYTSKIRFNDPFGELGFVAFDNTSEPTIRFCQGEELAQYHIKQSTRMITRIDVGRKVDDDIIISLNRSIDHFRKRTFDIFLTPFKGMRKDGMYRRRMDYTLARRLISKHM